MLLSDETGPLAGKTVFALACFTAFFVLGGGTRQGLPIESVLQLLGLILAAMGIHQLAKHRLLGEARVLLGVWVAFAGWLAVQIMPLPLGWGAALSGREAVVQSLEAAGVTGHPLAISLDRDATLRALLASLPPLGMFVYALSLRTNQRVDLLRWIVGLSFASVLLGLLQLAGGPESVLRWHEFTNDTSAVGTFANRNHLASALVMSMPLAAVLLAQTGREKTRWHAQAAAPIAVVMLVSLILGVAVSRSRAGLALGAVAVLGSLVLMWRARHVDADSENGKGNRRHVLLAVFLGLVVCAQWGFAGLADRLAKDPLDDFRWTISSQTWSIAQRYGPLGVGAGTFEKIYQAEAPLLRATDKVVNRAHNDWLEWRLEGGWPLIAIIAVGIAALVSASVRAWRARHSTGLWAAAASIGLFCLLLHSIVDYPLRTTAIACVAAVLAAHLVADTRSRARRGSDRPHHSGGVQS